MHPDEFLTGVPPATGAIVDAPQDAGSQFGPWTCFYGCWTAVYVVDPPI